ncbi:MAG: DUF4136 domain-containing protein [Myxococcales bacterium]|nr:DUF4136 domain-containing protein [Myxococcales bacterium]
MKRQASAWLGIVALGWMVAGCAETPAIQVSANAPVSQAVGAFDTYFLEVTPEDHASRYDWLVERMIHDDLRQKGYRPVDRAHADVIVQFTLKTSEHDSGGGVKASGTAQVGSAETALGMDITKLDPNGAHWHSQASAEVAQSHEESALMDSLHQMLAAVPRHGT